MFGTKHCSKPTIHNQTIIEPQPYYLAASTMMADPLTHKPNAYDGLLVAFPSLPRSQIHDGKRRQRKVTIKPFSEMGIIPEDKSADKAYSREDIVQFKQSLLLDVLQMRRELASTLPEHITREQFYRCTGVEHLLAQDTLASITAARRAHVVVVLEEQRRQQDQRNALDEDKLSRVSMESSQWARARAEALASGSL